MPGNRTVDGAFAKIEGHETLCDERHKVINAKLNAIITGIGVVTLSIFGWMAVTIYTLEPLRIAAAAAARGAP